MSAIFLLPCWLTMQPFAISSALVKGDPSLHESNIWNTFFFIPKALPTLRGLWSQPLVWSEHLVLPRCQKKSSRETVEAIWDVHSRAEKNPSRIIFGLRKDKQICDLHLGQKTVAGNGWQRHRRSWLVCRSEQGIAVHYFLSLRTVDLKKSRHHISVWNYVRGVTDHEEYKCCQKVAG